MDENQSNGNGYLFEGRRALFAVFELKGSNRDVIVAYPRRKRANNFSHKTESSGSAIGAWLRRKFGNLASVENMRSAARLDTYIC